MSQHIFTVRQAAGKDFVVEAGWDRPLQCVFLTILWADDIDCDTHGPLYCNLDDLGATNQDWAYFENILSSFGIVAPEGFADAIKADERIDVGNATTVWDLVMV